MVMFSDFDVASNVNTSVNRNRPSLVFRVTVHGDAALAVAGPKFVALLGPRPVKSYARISRRPHQSQ
jgi:hypothetical protein